MSDQGPAYYFSDVPEQCVHRAINRHADGHFVCAECGEPLSQNQDSPDWVIPLMALTPESESSFRYEFTKDHNGNVKAKPSG